MVVPQRKAGGRLFARRCTHRKIPCCQIAAAICPKTALVTPHAAVVDLNDIPHWCRGFLKECKVHIVIIQLSFDFQARVKYLIMSIFNATLMLSCTMLATPPMPKS